MIFFQFHSVNQQFRPQAIIQINGKHNQEKMIFRDKNDEVMNKNGSVKFG